MSPPTSAFIAEAAQVGKAMLDDRKSKILHKIVAEHIDTGQPVGSAHVVRDPDIDVSPATVRADMAALEREGYLSQPHTSAGRVPTDKGYRFFVDHLETDPALDPRREREVRYFFEHAHGELEAMLRSTSQFLSQLTDYAAVVVAPTHEAVEVRSSLFTRLSERQVLVLLVFSNGGVDKHVLPISEETTDLEIELADAAFREHVGGQALGKLSSPEPTGSARVDALVEAGQLLAANANANARGDTSAEVYVGGTAHMAEQFNAFDTVRKVLSILEESFVVVSLLQEVLQQGQTVSIGTENRVESLAECSLVVAPYGVGEDVAGTIGVLGPTRMNYEQALAAVATVSQRLGRQLSSG